MRFGGSNENLGLLVAVHFISELTKSELIIIIPFKHNYVYLSPSLRINVFSKLDAVLDIAPLYSTSCYTSTMGVASGHGLQHIPFP